VNGPTLVRTPHRQAEWKKIPEAMRALWRACLPEQDGGDVARSLTINFVGVAPAADQETLQWTVDRLQRRTPCRAFLLLLDEEAKVGTAELAATTRCHGSVRDIVLEEIVIRLPEQALAQMPGLVRPLLMNDLPNHLYWAAAWPQKAATFDAIAGLCDHAVVDSRRFVAPARDLLALRERRAAGRRITDLSWLRLRPWRRALAEAFERLAWATGTPASARIRHGRQGLAGAMLLGEWLRERIGARIDFDTGGDDAVVGPDTVVVRTAAFEVEIVARAPQLRVHVTTPEHCFLPFAVPSSRGTDGDLLGAAIDLGGSAA